MCGAHAKKGKIKQQIHGHVILKYMNRRKQKSYTYIELRPGPGSGLNEDYEVIILFTCEKK